MRFIDADELKDHQFHGCYTDIHIASNTDAYMLGWNDAIDAIVKCAPTVDAVPVKHGHWAGIDDNVWECDVCGWIYEDDEPYYNFCPHCGAKMEVEDE